jgi:hypothetical protein
MAKTAFTVNTFQLANGAPVVSGFLRIRLNQPGSVSDAQINTIFTEITLNTEGVIEGSPTFWPNSEISPSSTYYILQVFSSTGQQVAGPLKVTV